MLEPVGDDKFAVRLGLRQVRDLSNKDGAEIVAASADRPFESVDDLWRRLPPRRRRSPRQTPLTGGEDHPAYLALWRR